MNRNALIDVCIAIVVGIVAVMITTAIMPNDMSLLRKIVGGAFIGTCGGIAIRCRGGRIWMPK